MPGAGKKPRDLILKIAQTILIHISLPCSTTYREAVRITSIAKIQETPSSLAKQILFHCLKHSRNCDFHSLEA